MQSAYAGPGAGAPAGPPLGAGTGTDATQPKQQSVPAGGQAHFGLVSHCTGEQDAEGWVAQGHPSLQARLPKSVQHAAHTSGCCLQEHPPVPLH